MPLSFGWTRAMLWFLFFVPVATTPKPSDRTCTWEQYQCDGAIARCIPQGWQCDGEDDCPNGDDEFRCLSELNGIFRVLVKKTYNKSRKIPSESFHGNFHCCWPLWKFPLFTYCLLLANVCVLNGSNATILTLMRNLDISCDFYRHRCSICVASSRMGFAFYILWLPPCCMGEWKW